MKEVGREPGVPGLVGHGGGHDGPGVLGDGHLHVQHQAALPGSLHRQGGPTGGVAGPARLEGPHLGSGGGGGGQQLQQEVGVGSDLLAGHLRDVIGDVVVGNVGEGNLRDPGHRSVLATQTKLGEFSTGTLDN